MEQDELPDLQDQMQPETNFEEPVDDQFPTTEGDICNFKNENISIEQYDNVDHFQSENEKNSMMMENIIEGSSEMAYENINSAGFEEGEGMEAETNEQSSHQESFFPLPCEKQELNEGSMLSDANIITGSDDGFDTYENEILEPTEEQNEAKESEFTSETQPIEKTFYYKETAEDEEEEEEEDETIVQSEEYFQEEQSTDNEAFTEETVFIESGFQNVEEYGSSEQIIETTESEIPPVFINDEMTDSVQGIVGEETVLEGDYKTYSKGKTVISKDSVLQLNQSSANLKKTDNVSSVQTSLKRPLLPGPGQQKNVYTKVIIQGNPSASGISNQPFKIIGNASSTLVSGQTRSISLAQAQQMGLLAPGTKIQQIIPSSSSPGTGQKRMIYKKIAPTCSSSLLTPSSTAKSPTKILPAPTPVKGSNIRPSLTTLRGPVSVANIQTIRGSMPVATIKAVPSIPGNNRPVPVAAITALRQSGFSNVNLKPVGVKNLPGTQKVIIRQGQLPLKSGTIISPNNAGQVIRIPANANTLQPIQISGGKQVQYVRFVSGSGNTTPTTVINNSKAKMLKSPLTQSSIKTLPIAPNPTTTVKTVLPKPVASTAATPATAKRIFIPVSQGMSQLCIANDITAEAEGEEGEKQQTIATVPITLQQLKNTGSITAIPSSAVAHLRQGRGITALTNTQLAQLKTGQTSGIQLKPGDTGVIPVSAVSQANSDGSFIMSEGQIVMLPAEIVQQIQGDASNGEVTMESNEAKSKASSENEVNDEESFEKEHGDSDGCRSGSPGRILEANGIRMKKPCNCTRSQCLKLYCECFANGEFCFQCNCNNCFNNIQHEEERQKSIRSCLERNPSAFRPKIQIGETEEDERRHNKGCHCKRSGCLKNYCECYEAKITCSKSCKCIGCKNTEEFLEGTRSGLIELADAVEETFNSEQKSDYNIRSQSTISNLKQPYNFMSSEVVEATCQCLLAQAEEAERNGLSTEEGERLIIEEFGRCLVQIIGCSNPEENAAR